MRNDPGSMPQRPSRDAPPAPPGAGVSFVMPVLNERDYLARAVASTLAQEVDGPIELVLALGPSTDGTGELARRLATEDPRIVLVDNPAADIPVGLNLAIRASQYPTIARVDAHSELSPGYTARALRTLERTRAANVGGVMRAEGTTAFQRAAAAAYNSRIGLGGSTYHGGQAETEAESAYLGVMRRTVLEEVGFFDESIRRGCSWSALKGYDYRWLDVSFEVKDSDELAKKAFAASEAAQGTEQDIGDEAALTTDATSKDKQPTREAVQTFRKGNALVPDTYNGSDFETKGALRAAKDAAAALDSAKGS